MEEANGSPRSISVGNLSDSCADSQDGFFLINDCMEFYYVNETMQDWVGVEASKSQAVGVSSIAALGGSNGLFQQHCSAALTGSSAKFAYEVHPQSQTSRWLEFSLQRTPDGQLLGIARDIHQQKQEIHRLQFKSCRDELTGLLNRTEFMRLLRNAPVPAADFEQALLIIELEHFNIINDMCGIVAGDELLCKITELIRSTLCRNDILARIGGKKFAILCSGCSMDIACTKSGEVRDKIAGFKFESGNRQLEIGVSIGFTSIQYDTEESRLSAMSEADSACHYARNQGHNRIHAYSRSGNNSYRQQEAEWITRIATAFENERFQLYYQNIQEINTGHEYDDHHEILLRMLDEDGCHITPDEFIPAAEKYNLMPLIDRWVIRTLFARNAATWRATYKLQQAGVVLPMSLCCVNISGASLNDDYFREFLRDQILLHNVPPQAVCFELTETVAVNDLARASSLIKELRAEGFLFALDDFGKGMSSFPYLQSLAVDFLKIDGSLVQNIDTNKTDLCMVEAINRIAQQMGIKTIAEYVKSQAVIDMLQVLGVNYVQGFGIHSPEPLH